MGERTTIAAATAAAERAQAEGRLHEAEILLRRVLASHPRHAAAWLQLGTVLHEQSRFDEAIRCYRSSIDVAPGSAAAHNNCGAAYQALGRLEEAAECYREAVRLAPAA